VLEHLVFERNSYSLASSLVNHSEKAIHDVDDPAWREHDAQINKARYARREKAA